MGADRPDAETVAREELALAAGIAAVGERLLDLEVVAPAGELEAVEAPPRAACDEVCDRQVGPLAGEQGDGTRHRRTDPTMVYRGVMGLAPELVEQFARAAAV